MAVYCAIYEDSNYWDGTTAWGYDATSDVHNPTPHPNQAARDAQYTAAYTDLMTWEAARASAGSGDDEYGIIQGPWDNSDTLVEADIASWSSQTSITVRAIGDARVKGVKNNGVNGAWRCEAAEDKFFLQIEETNVTLDGLQFINTHLTDALVYNLYTTTTSADGLIVSNCLLEATKGSATRFDVAGDDYIIFNCIAYATDGGADGIYFDACTTGKAVNCTSHGFADGFERDAGTVDVYNSISFGNTDDFDGAFNIISYCASDDGDATDGSAVAPSGGDWANEMSNYANDDYELDAAGNLYDGGTDDPLGDGSGSPDVAGTTRTSTWSIGAWEYDVVGGVAPTGTFFGPLYGPFRGVL